MEIDGVEWNVLKVAGNDEVGYRIIIFRIPPSSFGAEKLPLYDFAQELTNNYYLGSEFNSYNRDERVGTQYSSTLEEAYEQGWYVIIDKYGVAVGYTVMKAAEDELRAKREAEIEQQKKQLTFD
jgi:hypothetical protein